MPDVVEAKRASSRSRARELLNEIREDLRGATLIIDFDNVRVAAPSFVDELVHVTLAERRAAKLKLRNVAPMIARFADDSAARRELADRISVNRKPDQREE